MNQLKSITYINAASIPFAKVNLDGNTLMVGANGAGKTTVLRSALYFYGVHENSALGINIRKKKGFTDYYFHELNSFIAYRYTNHVGNVLVIAYRSGSSNIKFKFVLEREPIDDMELFFDNRIGKSPEELWKKLNSLGYSVSGSVSKLADYRHIIYGNAGDAYKQYAFFHSKDDYRNFIHVLSNIFINSKLDASSIQKTISNAIAGFEPIDLEQIDRSIDDFQQKYNDVTKFEASKGTVDNILNTLLEYEDVNKSSEESIAQLLSNEKAFLLQKESLEEKIADDELLFKETSEQFQTQEKNYKEEKKVLEKDITILVSQIEIAEEKKRNYQNEQIDEKLQLYATKEKVQTEYATAEKKLLELTSTQSTITEKFAKLRETEESSFHQKIQDIDTNILTLNQEFQDKREQMNAEKENEIQELYSNSSRQIEVLNQSLKESNERKENAFKSKIESENKIFLEEELAKLSEKYTEDKTHYDDALNIIEKFKLSLEHITTKINAQEKEQELRLDALEKSFFPRLQKKQEDIQELMQFLNVKKDTFLGFIKEIQHPHEETIVALLKNEVLLNTKLAPSFSMQTDTFFGLNVDTNNLEDSNYSKENILRKIASFESQIKTLEKEKKVQIDVLNNEFKNRLNRLRREYRNYKELLDTTEHKIPKLKSEYLKSEDTFKECKEESFRLKEEAVAKTEALYVECALKHSHLEKQLEAYEKEMKVNRESIVQKYKEIKSRAEKEKIEKERLYKSAKITEKEFYIKNIERINSDESKALMQDGVDAELLSKYQNVLQGLKNQLNQINAVEELVVRYKHDKDEHFDPLEKKCLQRDSLVSKEEEKVNDFRLLKNKYKEKLAQLSNTLESNHSTFNKIKNDLDSMQKSLNINALLKEKISKDKLSSMEANSELLEDIVRKILSLGDQEKKLIDAMRTKQDLFYRNFEVDNSLDLTLPSDGSVKEVIKNAYELKNFMLDGKLEEFEEEISGLFSLTINQLTKQTESLLEARQNVDGIVSKIRKMLRDLEGISVIDSIDLRTQQSSNSILAKLEKLKTLNDEYNFVGQADLFNFDKPKNKNAKEAIHIIDTLRKELERTSKKELLLDDTYALEIRASENGNDTGWQVSLDEVGSNGTDVMIKTIVNIAMLSISLGFKANTKSKTYFHCILDEIGVLHPSYLKELISFANNKQIRFLNGAPNRQLVSSFKRIYLLMNKNQNTMIKPLLSQQ